MDNTKKGEIRVLLVDDHTLVRQGMRRLLDGEPDIEVIGEAASGLEAVEKVKTLAPDLVILDYALGDLNGLHVTHRLKKMNPEIKILILTMHEEDEYVIETLKAGASGYVLKNSTAPELLTAIYALHRGEMYLSPKVSKQLVNSYVKPSSKEAETSTRREELTNKEKEVLKLLAEGLTVKEIAYKLNLATKTIDVHKYNLMKKLNIHDRTELIKYAIRKKIIRLEG